MIALAGGLRDARLADMVARLSAGSGPGVILLYGGTQPAPGASPGAAPVLAMLTLADPAGTITAHVLDLAFSAPQFNALGSGTITWGRAQDSDAGWVFDGDAGAVGSDALFQMPSRYVLTGGLIPIVSAQIAD